MDIKTKEEILDSNNVYWIPNVSIERADIWDAMDKYAKQECIEFLKFIIDKNLAVNSSGFWFDSTLSRDNVRFYTIEQVYEYFKNGELYQPDLSILDKFLQSKTQS